MSEFVKELTERLAFGLAGVGLISGLFLSLMPRNHIPYWSGSEPKYTLQRKSSEPDVDKREKINEKKNYRSPISELVDLYVYQKLFE